MSKTRCSALDHDGKLCPKSAIGSFNLHLDHEVYSRIDGPAIWIQAPLCQEHATSFIMETKVKEVRMET